MDIIGDETKEYNYQVNVSIEPKVELLGVIQYLANDPTIIQDSSEYSQDIANYFYDYVDNIIISTYNELRKKGFAFHLPPKLMLYIDESLRLRDDIDVDEDLIKVFGNKSEINKFLILLKNFEEESKFNDFYKNHYRFYNDAISYVRNKLCESNCINNLISYYGFAQNSYNIIIQPLSIGGYAVRIPTIKDTFDSYNFMKIPENTIDFVSLILHEFGHTYVNPLTRENIEAVNKYSYLFEEIRDSMLRQAYPTWELCVNEHVVRAITNRILFNMYGEKVSELRIKNDLVQNFKYINVVCERLLKYESERFRYLIFNDFYTGLFV